MTIALVHGFPETADVWRPLEARLDRPAIALSLPGFGAPRTSVFEGTKDAYAEWLAGELSSLEEPVDVVAHDVGALLMMRVASAQLATIRSWVVDVADVFHPRFQWPQPVVDLQDPTLGEAMLRLRRTAQPDDPAGTTARLVSSGIPEELARAIGSAHDEAMSQSILEFYRSAMPNVAAGWWDDINGPTPSRGLVLLLPDPPEVETLSIEVAERLGAATVRLDSLNHAWMAQAPDLVGSVLKQFWSTLE